MAGIPKNIRVHRDNGVLEIVWADSVSRHYPFRYLRLECPCALCINEFTGERILKPETVPADVHPAAIEFAGNYGLKIAWSDEHHSGIYTWDQFSRLDPAAG